MFRSGALTASGVGGCLAKMIRLPKLAAFKKFAPRPFVPAAALLVGLLPITARAASTAADLAPAESVAFLALPDPIHTTEAWRGTELFKLWNEPEVRTFLERSLARVPVQS